MALQRVRGKEEQEVWNATSGKKIPRVEHHGQKQKAKAWNEAGENSGKTQGVEVGCHTEKGKRKTKIIH